jgi:E3 ubiquitin-protein ligase HUWE1
MKEFVQTTSTTPLPLLRQQLATFPSRWPFPRDDLYHWIPLLNRFDDILEKFCVAYGLKDGPQTMEFGSLLLSKELLVMESQELDRDIYERLKELGYGPEGDREVVETILDFTRILLENCGNRTIYSSSPLLSDLLNSTSLSLIAATLQIGSQLAQRYQASFKRLSTAYRQHNSTLLAIHYNINLSRVEQLAQPFTRTSISTDAAPPQTPATPGSTAKGKGSYFATPAPSRTRITNYYANDLVSIASEDSKGNNGGPFNIPAGPSDSDVKSWGDVRITYYDTRRDSQEPSAIAAANAPVSAPTTPTPIRRTSSMGTPSAQRSSRLANTEDSPSQASRQPASLPDDGPSKASYLDIPDTKIATTSLNKLLDEYLPQVPKEMQYELLTRLRVEKALTTSIETRRQALAVRILAVTNLAYIHGETTFLEKVLKQDSDEPRRLQLIYQLADMIHPPVEGREGIPRWLQTIALAGLKALANYPGKFADICAALNTTVSHGVLLYIVRKAVAEMEIDEPGEKLTEGDEWRGAVFSLLSDVATLPRAGQDMVAAGLAPILVEVLKLRTSVAEQNYPMVLDFLDAFIFNVRDAFGILANADGLDAISDLIVYEVDSATKAAESGEGMKTEFRSQQIDYEIPYFKQQSLKWLFKFIHHMMTTAGGYNGNFDRLLRNLIDSSKLLASLKAIMGNSQRFGSTVWTNSVRILNDFINNEPTSFAVIAEAGLSRQILESITGREIRMPDTPAVSQPPAETTAGTETSPSTHTVDEDDDEDGDSAMSPPMVVDDTAPHPPTLEMLETPRDGTLAQGIPPSVEAITIIPSAFSALCLNSSGMRMLQASNALQSFFEVFESPKHVQCMENDANLIANLGATFEELIRHHAPLKPAIVNAIIDMVARVAHMCKKMALSPNVGAKLWTINAGGQTVMASPHVIFDGKALSADFKGKGKSTTGDDDVQMGGVEDEAISGSAQESPQAGKPGQVQPSAYIYVVSMFLSALFNNSGMRQAFIEKGGQEFVLDLAESPCLPAVYPEEKAYGPIQGVISMLAEQKPHIVLPSLLKRAQAAADKLSHFSQYHSKEQQVAYFTPFIDPAQVPGVDRKINDRIANGTQQIKAFVHLYSLTRGLLQCFQIPSYNHRTTVQAFHQVNLSDLYVRFVKTLGPLLGAMTKESFLLSMTTLVPPNWKVAANRKSVPRPASFDLSAAIQQVEPLETGVALDSINGVVTAAVERESLEESVQDPTEATSALIWDKPMTPAEADSWQFKNYKSLRYILAKLPLPLNLFLQGLGKIVITKRISDPYQRQSNLAIADTIAETVLSQLTPLPSKSSLEQYTYFAVFFQTVKDILIYPNRGGNGERAHEVIIAVLQAFKERGGFDILNQLLNIFAEDIKHFDGKSKADKDAMDPIERRKEDVRSKVSALGIKQILTVYFTLVTGKNISEAAQTTVLGSRSERHGSRSEPFNFGQLVVELRAAILPMVRKLWESTLVETINYSIPNRLVDIIRAIAQADMEHGAHKRAENYKPPAKPAKKPWKPSTDALSKLTDASYDADLAREALYRCLNNQQMALEYCKAQVEERAGGRTPVAEEEMASTNGTDGSPTDQTTTSTGHSTPQVMGFARDLANADAPATTVVIGGTGPLRPPTDPMAMSVDSLLEGISATLTGITGASSAAEPSTSTHSDVKVVTIEDLNEERAAIRDRLIERCLDVVNAHGEVTFEIADLITTVVANSDDAEALRQDMGSTLVEALMSFALEEDIREVGKKVAAYAHLLALILQNKDFHKACVGLLQEHLPSLLDFVKLSPIHSAEESSPWIAPVLLVLEILLSEDAQPAETEWKYPNIETVFVMDKPVLKLVEPVVSQENRDNLFIHILEILHRIGKDESLALAVLRILVILTRTRSIAIAMGEKKNIQRLFVMAKQLAGVANSRVQGPLMMILRHVIEDEDTIRQTMRAEIKAFFDQPRQRNIDVSAYIRHLAPLVIRAPQLFVEVTNEMVRLAKWSSSVSDAPGRQQVVLQDAYSRTPRAGGVAISLPPIKPAGDITLPDVKPSTEATEPEPTEAAKPAHVEQKAPVVENPDGVIHFLLCELMNYRDVEDKDISPPQLDQKDQKEPETGSADTAMADASSTTKPAEAKDSKKPSKQEFKQEDHPIYIYRCFLMQCLAELLSCYNRTKIEFINFKRSHPPQAMTPSRPRSSVVNYLLFDLVPVGTLDHTETISLRKKMTTSSWADSVICALLAKTGEQMIDRDRERSDPEDEPDLYFVRKFVLDNILKAYREASSSSEPLDVRYARMLSLADLMGHLMVTKEEISASGATDRNVAGVSGYQLRRIMFEKGFVGALTSSLAEIDLNFPGAKRAVKHILRPLKTLTQTAIELSDSGLITMPPGQAEAEADEADIATASSVSDIDEDREDTPDLFRNSALGMFEVQREDESSDEDDDDDEEMYEGEFDEEGMEYEMEDEDEDPEDNISDEDEEIEGMGPIEGLSGDHGHDVEIIMDDGDDDDDESTDEDEDGEDDDESDMGDDDEGDDEHAHVEFLDEHGNPMEGGEDDADEWESEDEDDLDEEDEEDYEGRAVDDEDDHHHDHHLGHGAISHLVRALGGDDHQGAVEILHRMDDAMDEEQMELGDYMEDVEGDEGQSDAISLQLNHILNDYR